MEMTHWYWWVLAMALLVLEMLLPTTFFLGAAVAAASVGLLVLVAPAMSFAHQLLAFSVTSIISVFISRFLFTRGAFRKEGALSNHRGADYIGRTFILSESIINGIGRIRADDGFWRVEGEDCLAGKPVKVIGVEGTRLRVQPLPAGETND
ncbi:MAG: hypothetical protein BWK79_18135 [Beggiatoa sp. IS2]|nr:MAG: hypothetical protein BWK79_18135 [Beggiatoa sp. IS2]